MYFENTIQSWKSVGKREREREKERERERIRLHCQQSDNPSETVWPINQMLTRALDMLHTHLLTHTHYIRTHTHMHIYTDIGRHIHNTYI